MAKRMVTLTAIVAALLALAVPAMAQEAAQEQYVPGTAVGDEFAGFGVIAEVEGGYGLEISADQALYLEGDADFASFVGENVYVNGTITSVAPTILTVEVIEPAIEDGQEATVTGVVFEDDDFSDGTLYNVREEGTDVVYPLAGGPGTDFTPYLDQRTTLYGTFIEQEPNGNTGLYLSVSRAELAEAASGGTTTGETTLGEATTSETTLGETTLGETTGPSEEQYEDGGTPEQAGIDLNEDGAVDEADGDFAVQTSDEGVSTTPEEGALPGTGGLILPVAGIAGAALLAGGLLYRRKLAS